MRRFWQGRRNSTHVIPELLGPLSLVPFCEDNDADGAGGSGPAAVKLLRYKKGRTVPLRSAKASGEKTPFPHGGLAAF